MIGRHTNRPRRGRRLDHAVEYQHVATYGRLEQAEVARGVLEADGIPVALIDVPEAALGLGPAVSGVRLLVPPWDLTRAQDLLAEPVEGALEWPSVTPAPFGVAGLATVTPPPGSQAAARPDEGAERRFLVVRYVVVLAVLLAGAALLAVLR